MSERKPGWYWCKDSYGEGMPLWWDGMVWKTSVDYSKDSIYPKRVMHTGSRIPTPDDPWQCVPVEPTQKMRQSTGLGAQRELVMWKAWDAMLESAPKPEEI